MHPTREVIGRPAQEISINKSSRQRREILLGNKLHERNIQIRETKSSRLGPNQRGLNPVKQTQLLINNMIFSNTI